MAKSDKRGWPMETQRILKEGGKVEGGGGVGWEGNRGRKKGRHGGKV